ncbi:MAG TPA: hypothetical protein VEA78_08875 [Acidimicrobiales bacterium]|nr:hypothetical protein [Acidimicrobiales bacterium]
MIDERRTFPLATVLVALATAALLLVLPTYSSGDTLVEANGNGVLGVLLVPAALALVGVLVPHRAVLITIAVVLSLATLLAMLSIGILFVPTTATAWLGVAKS